MSDKPAADALVVAAIRVNAAAVTDAYDRGWRAGREHARHSEPAELDVDRMAAEIHSRYCNPAWTDEPHRLLDLADAKAILIRLSKSIP